MADARTSYRFEADTSSLTTALRAARGDLEKTSLAAIAGGQAPRRLHSCFNNPSAYTPQAAGTNYVPYDGFKASLHKGEAVVPAKYNPAAGGRASASMVNITQNVTVGEGVTRGEVYQAVKSANAELMQTLMRSRNRGWGLRMSAAAETAIELANMGERE